jgi:hypothetical protein
MVGVNTDGYTVATAAGAPDMSPLAQRVANAVYHNSPARPLLYLLGGAGGA